MEQSYYHHQLLLRICTCGILFSITLSSKLNTVPALNVAVPLNTNDVPLILTTVILFKLFPGSVTIAPTLISSFDAVSVTFVNH